MWLIALALVLIAAGVAAFYYKKYNDNKKEVARLSNPTVAAQQEANQLIAKVGNLIQLPAGQTPTIATVTDITKLKAQVFFASSQNGDKLLIYTQAKKAILYRPTTNKIINVAPLNIGKGTNNNSSTNNSNSNNSNTTNSNTTP